MTRLRCAIYCRVSTDEQSTDRQENELKQFATRQDYEVVEIHADVISGASTKRKGRDKVIELVRKREVDVVLVSELSRWGRSMQDLIATTNEMHSKGVSLVCLNGMSFDLNRPDHILMRDMLAAFAQFERNLIRERVISGVRNAQSKGKHCGRPKQTTGKLYGQNYAPLRGRIKNLRRNGVSIRQIAKQCGCSTTTVQAILKA